MVKILMSLNRILTVVLALYLVLLFAYSIWAYRIDPAEIYVYKGCASLLLLVGTFGLSAFIEKRLRLKAPDVKAAAQGETKEPGSD